MCSPRRPACGSGEGSSGCSPSLHTWPAEGPCLCQAAVGMATGSHCDLGAGMGACVLGAASSREPCEAGTGCFLLGVKHSLM